MYLVEIFSKHPKPYARARNDTRERKFHPREVEIRATLPRRSAEGKKSLIHFWFIGTLQSPWDLLKLVQTLTGSASFRIFPQDIASSGRAPLSLPSNSEAVFKKTAKSAPFLCKNSQELQFLYRNFKNKELAWTFEKFEIYQNFERLQKYFEK